MQVALLVLKDETEVYWICTGPNQKAEARIATQIAPVFMVGSPSAYLKKAILTFLLYQSWIESCRPLLMSQGGHTAASLSRLEDDTRWEIMNLAYPFYLRIVAVSATKKR